MSRKLLTIALAFVCSLILFTPSTQAASEIEEPIVIQEEDSTLIFDNKNDYQRYQEANSQNLKKSLDGPIITPFAYKETKTLISSTRKNKLWVGYHSGTPNWSKANAYTLTKSKTYSTSGSYTYEGIGVNLGFSYTTGTTTTIPANPARFSKLGVSGDFTFNKYKVTVQDPLGTWSYNKVEKTRHNYYLAPKYQ